MDMQPDLSSQCLTSQCPSEMQGKTIGCCWEVCSVENVIKLQNWALLHNVELALRTAKCYLWVCVG